MKLKVFISTLPAFAVLCIGLMAAPAAQAQLTLNLTNVNQAGKPGQAFTFSGILSNPTANAVSLNTDNFTFNGPGVLDDSPFFTGSPLSLEPKGSTDGLGNPTDSYTGGFFDLTMDQNAAPGTYLGTFSIVGGADINATDTVATEDFMVTVQGAPAVPEASTTVSLGLLLALGLGGVAVSARRRKAASTP